jgi:hypothetical protein
MDTEYQKNQRKALRHEKKRQQLGSPNPLCSTCGCMNIVQLTSATISQLPEALQRKLHEEHHMQHDGPEMEDRTTWTCLNCHAVFTDACYEWDPRVQTPQTSMDRLAAFLQGLADWFRQLGETLLGLADALQEWVNFILSGAWKADLGPDMA